MVSKKQTSIYQLRIALLDIKPAIYRIFQIKGNASLGKLHDYIQGVMGWDDCHMHEFRVMGKRYVSNEQMGDEIKYNPDMFDEKMFFLNDLVKQGDKFDYIYDFGDYWQHEITVEKLSTPEDGVYYPVCIAGEMACPPEDCGGPMGYENLLGVLSNPEDEEYEDYSEWIGDYDPKEFNINEVNNILNNIKSNLREPR